MRIAVTGSIATDHLMTFPGRFTDQLVSGKIESVSLSFLVDALEIRRGGIAANIAFGMACLGLRPVLVGAVGADFDEYRSWLERKGVDTTSVHVSQRQHTARFLCTTDTDQNQIASFYAGAMSEARDIELGPVAGRHGGLDLVVISPNDPLAMLRHTAECRALKIPFVADPSQQLARMDGEEIRKLVDGASYLFTNEYEAALTEQKTGWSHDEVLRRVGARITTMGPKGARVDRVGEPSLAIPAVAVERPADPTGGGDAFRAGFLAALAWDLSLERATQLGNMIAVHALETVGPQEYELDRGRLLDRFTAAYGDGAAAEVAAHL